MESRELRIGNIVNCEYHYNDCPNPKKFNAPIEIESIRRDSVTLSTFQDVEIEYLSGIPLTEEWLLFFGGKEIGFEWQFKIGEFTMCFEKRNDKFYYTGGEGVQMSRNIEFVHDFQNLVYALEGIELTAQELNQ
jgi:hypothetical protein